MGHFGNLTFSLLLIRDIFNMTNVKGYYQTMQFIISLMFLDCTLIYNGWNLKRLWLTIVQKYLVYMNLLNTKYAMGNKQIHAGLCSKHKVILFLWTFSIYLMYSYLDWYSTRNSHYNVVRKKQCNKTQCFKAIITDKKHFERIHF